MEPGTGTSLRLVTWNARSGSYAVKSRALEQLGYDVAVVPEAAQPPPSAWSAHCDWFGDNPSKGVAVMARPPYAVRRLPERDGVPSFIVPYAVEGPLSFTLLAVWTKANDNAGKYIRAAAHAIDAYEDLFAAGPVVMMGDFNSNAIWDSLHPATANHSSVVARLDRHGLVSAYHACRGHPHGAEPDPTFFLHGNRDKPFHIDYVFVPERWTSDGMTVEVGDFDQWKSLSDHRPVVVNLIFG